MRDDKYNIDLRIAHALQWIDASDRDTWVRMGMAIKAELGDAGFDLWDHWSQQAQSYKTKDAQATWRSLRAGGGVTIGTLFHEARACGWQERSASPPSHSGAHQAQQPRQPQLHPQQAQLEQSRADAVAKANTAVKALALWHAATAALPNHPYLVRKAIAPTATLRELPAAQAHSVLGYRPQSSGHMLTGRLLVVPVKQGDALSTVELIDEHGRKTALAGQGSKSHGYWAAQALPQPCDAASDTATRQPTILVGEGVATVLSAQAACIQHTHAPAYAVAALSASNLIAVTGILRTRYPQARIVVLADLIKATGVADVHAAKAATQHHALLAVPTFGLQRQPHQTDFNDMQHASGLTAVAQCIGNAIAMPDAVPDAVPDASDSTATASSSHQAKLLLTCADALRPEPITWLWDGWLAAGKLHVLGGAPGTGKTSLAMAMAATVSAGGRWPDGSRCQSGNVVIWSGEDDPRDTLMPRLQLSGAHLKRVHFVSGVVQAGERHSFDPAQDVDILCNELTRIGNVRLLVIDPIVSAITGDSHKNAEVRKSLAPLVDLATTLGCALLGITHFSKGTTGREPVERLTGSLAFGALARVVLVAAKQSDADENASPVRLLCRAKSNIGPDNGGFNYNLQQDTLPQYPDVQASYVVWGKTLLGSARDLLADAEASDVDSEGNKLSDAKRFLTDLLRERPLPAKYVQSEARQAGYSLSTIRRAQTALAVKPVKTGMQSGWVWQLPVQTTQTNTTVANSASLTQPDDPKVEEVDL